MQAEKKMLTALVLWLTIAATSAWANVQAEVQSDRDENGSSGYLLTADEDATSAASLEGMADEVKLRDGSVVKPQRLPRRAPSEDYAYTYKGVKYTYITENNYTRFFNLSVHKPSDYGWYPDDDGWYVNAEKDYITAASLDEESVPANAEVAILNDLVGFFTSHTHLACIADHGFTGESKVKRIYFQDCDAMAYSSNTNPYFFIGHLAFANAPHLEKVDLMYYITSGDNRWEPMPVSAVKRIWDNMLEGSSKAQLRVASSTLNDYKNSGVWTALKDRFVSYEPSGYEINEYGARYKCMLAEDNKTYLTNDGSLTDEVMKQLRLWNADYQSFNARQLMAEDANATIYYTAIEGIDNDYLKDNNGTLRIYNDVGSYYNYKTLAIRRGAFAYCDELKTVEFWQTNGRSENSYSDLKICIENGAFRGCKNLEEIRLYYYVQDGDDHWETLGPEDVIPGDDIFGWRASCEEQGDFLNPDVIETIEARIVVAPERYVDFLNDPNWSQYRDYIVPADYQPNTWTPLTEGGLTYDYVSKSVNTLSTDQVVTVSTSWWTAVYIAAEIAIMWATWGSGNSAANSAAQAATKTIETAKNEIVKLEAKETALKASLEVANSFSKGHISKSAAQLVKTSNRITPITELLGQPFKQLSKSTQKACLKAIIPSKVSTFSNIFWNGVSIDKSQLKIAGKAMVKFLKKQLTTVATDMAAQEVIIANTQVELNRLAALAIAKQTMKASLKGTAVASYMGSRFLPLYLTMSGEANESQMEDAMIENMKSNIHQVGMVGIGFTTPDKKLVYHTYISQVDPNQTDFTIYNDIGSAYNYRTMGLKRKAFQGNTKVQTIRFAESRSSSYDSYAPLLFSIPDSAFAGCTGLKEIDLRYKSAKGGELALGPENFVLCGDSIFAGCDSTQLRIIVGEERYQDFLDNESWAKYKRYLTTGKVAIKEATSGYGVKYAYVYDNNSTRHITYGMGHEIEHLYAFEADDDFLKSHSGAIGLFNDVGNWNNYHLDYVKKGAFRDNQNLKEVSFWNVNGIGAFGESYAPIDITLQDECFMNCENLESVGLVYLQYANTMRGTVRGQVKQLTPATLRLGENVFNNTPKLRLKMTPQQMETFIADSAWAQYKDKFTPCLFHPVDGRVWDFMDDMSYTLHCSSNNNTWIIFDATRLKEKGFSWFNSRFANKLIQEFPEFKLFETAGLDYIGGSWFVNCTKLRNIELPSTIKTIGGYAFQNCTSLPAITIPAAVQKIDEYAFSGAGLKTVHCEGKTPATLGQHVFFNCSNLSKIYVPAEAVETYKEAWSQYKNYIVSETEMPVIHYVKTTQVGQLAEKLGLQTIMEDNILTGLVGYYQQIDSLVVEGPLNGIDVGVLRFLGGANVNNSEPTIGRLRYLNLYGAQLKKDMEHPYQCWGSNDYLEEDDMVGDFMFTYCDRLQTIILPKTAKKIGENVFEEAHNLRHLAIGDETTQADNELFEDGTERLEELVFLNSLCTSDDKTCWEPGADIVYVPNALLEDYMGRNELTSSSQTIAPIFNDQEAHRCFVSKGHFFPSSFMQLTNIDGILNNKVKSFDELYGFQNMTDLGSAFNGCSELERVTLPDSLKTIGYSAFAGCKKLSKITVAADSVATLEPGTFRDLPENFLIYVPKTHTKRYRKAWAEYADHIVGDKVNTDNILEVTVNRENTLGEALGLKVSTERYSSWVDSSEKNKVTGISGDYRNITRLKVNGPISGQDIAVLRYLAGYCPWTDKPNLTGALEYLDLYDAKLMPSNWHFAQDKWTTRTDCVDQRDVLPAYAFLQCYQLKTLILPKSLKEIRSRAIMQCENLENVVIGDSIETINWSAFDDDVSLTRMYLLAKKKPEMDIDNFVWRNLCNNYNPTFDAFYVRPSLYNEYISDNDYVGTSWQRTNNISTGMFNNDEQFLCFGAHAAATEDDLTNVTDVSGWFKNHNGITDLTPLRYTLVETINASDMQPLTQLERISLPMTLEEVQEGAFSKAKNLRFADFQLCDPVSFIKDGGVRSLGLGENVLCYVPSEYGETDEVNVIVCDSTSGFRTKNFRLYDGKDYCVPYAFKAENVENTRILTKSAAPYTVCLPYDLDIPSDIKVYQLSGRSDNELIFAQTTERMEALQPYLIWAEDNDASLDASGDVSIPVSGGSTYGSQQLSPGFVMRGTLDAIPNREAAELGAYVMNDDAKWHPVLSDTEAHKAVTIPAFRCYLLQNRQGGTRAIGMALEDATGIEQLRTIDADGTERVYDLSGRRIDENTKGIVIKNGRKIIQK